MNFVGHLSDGVNGKLTFITFRDALIIVFNLRCLNPASATKKETQPIWIAFLFVLNMFSLHVAHHLLIITLSGFL